MDIFNKFGDLVIKFFSLLGTIILGIPKIPEKLRRINTEDIKNRIDTENLKENISKIKESGVEDKISSMARKASKKKKRTIGRA